MTSTMALGCATPATRLYPLAVNTYVPLSEFKVQSFAASATPDIPNAIAAATKLCLNALFRIVVRFIVLPLLNVLLLFTLLCIFRILHAHLLFDDRGHLRWSVLVGGHSLKPLRVDLR